MPTHKITWQQLCKHTYQFLAHLCQYMYTYYNIRTVLASFGLRNQSLDCSLAADSLKYISHDPWSLWHWPSYVEITQQKLDSHTCATLLCRHCCCEFNFHHCSNYRWYDVIIVVAFLHLIILKKGDWKWGQSVSFEKSIPFPASQTPLLVLFLHYVLMRIFKTLSLPLSLLRMSTLQCASSDQADRAIDSRSERRTQPQTSTSCP